MQNSFQVSSSLKIFFKNDFTDMGIALGDVYLLLADLLEKDKLSWWEVSAIER